MIVKVLGILIVLLIYLLALFVLMCYLDNSRRLIMKGDIMLTIGLILMAIVIPYNMYLRINNPNLDYLEILFKMIGLN